MKKETIKSFWESFLWEIQLVVMGYLIFLYPVLRLAKADGF